MQGMFPRPAALRFAPRLGSDAVTLAKHANSRALCDSSSHVRFLEENKGITSIQVFGHFRDFGEPSRRVKRGKNRSKNLKQGPGPTASFRLKPDGDSAANGSSTGTELSNYLAVVSVGLEVQKISGVEYSLSAHR